MTEWIFCLSLLLLLYTFAGYPLLLYLLSLVVNRDIRKYDIQPDVTIIIPVHNEEHQIGEKINNCIKIDYPEEKIKIIVVSDGSTDRTEEIVKGLNLERIRFLPILDRGGKVKAQNHAVEICDSDIIIFTDVAISTDPDCVKRIVRNFADETVGCVSCRDAIVGEHNEGEGNYIRYDMLVRKYTSRIGSIIGVTGGFYAVRKEIARGGWDPAFPPDFYAAIRSIQLGFRVIEDPEVRAYYKTTSRQTAEFQRKVRTINRGMHALFFMSNRRLLNPLKHGFVSVELISHKVLRWMLPFILTSLFLSNLMILNEYSVAILIFIPQLILYGMALSAFVLNKKNGLLNFALYFVITNMAILKAWHEFFIGKKYVIWQPTKR